MRIFCRIDELSKLNYAKDVELQSQRAQMEAMQVCISGVFQFGIMIYLDLYLVLRLELRPIRPPCYLLNRPRGQLRCDR